MGLHLKKLSQLANRQTTITNYLAKNNISSYLYIFAIQDNKYFPTTIWLVYSLFHWCWVLNLLLVIYLLLSFFYIVDWR